MGDAILLQPVEKFWRCPSCLLTERTIKDGVYTQFHACPAFSGANIPLIEVPYSDSMPNAVHEEREREDYKVHPDDPDIMSIHTRYGTGREDATVMAPTARIEIKFG